MSSLNDLSNRSDEGEISEDESAWEDYDSSEDDDSFEDDESLRESMILERFESSEETELSDDDLSNEDFSDDDFSAFSRGRNRFPQDPFKRPGSPCYAMAPKRWPPKFLKGDMVFFHVKNKKLKDTNCYRVADVNKEKKTYQLKQCFRTEDGRGCPLLFAEESEREMKRDREIRRLPGREQQAEFEKEESRHDKWVEEYKLMLEEDEKQPLYKDGFYFAQKLLRRLY